MDASGLFWFNKIYSTLHLAVDDAIGTVVGAYFDYQETLNGYYHVLKNILEKHGIPNEFLTDNRTVLPIAQLQIQLMDTIHILNLPMLVNH